MHQETIFKRESFKREINVKFVTHYKTTKKCHSLQIIAKFFRSFQIQKIKHRV